MFEEEIAACGADGAVVLQWAGRVEKLTMERDAIQMKFQLTTQACFESANART